MKRVLLMSAFLLCAHAIAGGPVGLVGAPGVTQPAFEPAASKFGFDWRWYFAAALLVALGVVLRSAIVGFAIKRSPSDAGFLALCRGLGVNRSERRTLESLSRSHGNASAASLILCPSAFETAASLVQSSSKGATKRNIERLRAKLS